MSLITVFTVAFTFLKKKFFGQKKRYFKNEKFRLYLKTLKNG
jgi:hypothetical protein